MKPIRILFLIPKLVVGGAERQLLALARGLDRGRFEVTVGALAEGGGLSEAFREAVLPVRVFGRGWRRDPAPIVKIASFCRANRVDIVHAFHFLDAFYGRLAAMLAGRTRTIASARGVEYGPHSLRSGVDRVLARHTSALVANSHWMAQRLAGMGFPREGMVVIPNGVDTDWFCPGVAPADGRLAGSEVVGSVGRLAPVKDYATFLRAAAILAEQRPLLRFVIVGEGQERPRLELLADQLGLRDRLLLPGETQDVRPFLAAMRVFVLCSTSESLPGALLEAMGYGLPCVATGVGGMPEIIAEGKNGRLAPAGDAEALADRVEDLLADAALRARLGAAARETTSRCFSLAAMTAGYESLYARLTRGRFD